MEYKGYVIEKSFLPGSNMRELENGKFVKSIPKKCDEDIFRTEHSITGEQLPNSLSFKEAKDFIDMYTAI